MMVNIHRTVCLACYDHPLNYFVSYISLTGPCPDLLPALFSHANPVVTPLITKCNNWPML